MKSKKLIFSAVLLTGFLLTVSQASAACPSQQRTLQKRMPRQERSQNFQRPSLRYFNYRTGQQDNSSRTRRLETPSATQSQEISADEIIKQTNIQRQKAGLAPLSENEKLNKAALLKANDMLKNQYFAHTSPNGTGLVELVTSAGYDYSSVGENLAYGNFENGEDVVSGWMNSSGHRANILSDRFEEIGVAVVQGEYKGKNVWMAVQEFGAAR